MSILDMSNCYNFILKLKFVFVICGILYLCNKANGQQFTRSCQDPLIQNHISTGHTYCYHACGYFGNPSTMDYSSCTPNGDCLCNYPCDSTPPANPFDTSICPPTNDPNDPDPLAFGRCTQLCASTCPGGGGVGEICGESLGPLGPNADIYAKICTCYCPPLSCTPATTTPTSITLALIKKPVWPAVLIKAKLLMWKLVFTKLLKFSLIVFKLCALFLLKLFLFGLYYYAFYEWISWEANILFRNGRWILGYLWDYWSG